MRSGLLRCLLLMLSMLPGVVPAIAESGDEPVLLIQSSSGSYDVDGESYLIIQDVEGTMSIRGAADNTIRFEGRSLNSKRDLQEVALWRSGERTLILGPGADVEAEGTLVDMVVPDSLDVEVVLNGGRVLVSAIGGDLLVDAEGAKVQARGLKADAEFLLEGGVLRVDGVKGTLSVEATDVDAGFMHLYADAELQLSRGRATINGSVAAVEIESSQTELSLEAVQGEVRVEGEGGSLRLAGCEGGGDIHLEGAALVLFQSKGDFSVRTDSPVEFNLHDGNLNLFSYGAPIRGSQVSGRFVAESNNSTVEVEQLAGGAEIRGGDLAVKAQNCTGPVNVYTVSSQVEISATKSTVLVENDYGDVRVSGTEGKATISSSGGNVTVANHQGPLELRADGPEVRIDWQKFSMQDAMSVHNATGDVHLSLPTSGRCQLQLKAPFGRIDSELEGIRIADDGHSGGGEYTGGRGRAPQVKKPVIKATSGGGNIYITAAQAQD